MNFKIYTIKELIPAQGKNIQFYMPAQYARCKRIFVAGSKLIDRLEAELSIGGKNILPMGFNLALISFSNEIPFNQNGIEIDEPVSNQLVEIKIQPHNLSANYSLMLDVYFINE